MFLAPTNKWYIQRFMFLFAGTFTFLSAILALTIDVRFLYFGAFVGVMQIVFAFTGFCPSAIVMKWLGVSCALDK